jgi:hypothetical protein
MSIVVTIPFAGNGVSRLRGTYSLTRKSNVMDLPLLPHISRSPERAS